MTANARIASLVSVAAGVLTAAVVVLPPSIYFLLSYERVAGSVEAEAEINSRSVTRIIGANPDLWEYEQVRLSEYLSRRPREGDAERRRVLDGRGAVVAESLDPLPTPWITRSVPLLDAGRQVGRIEISRSMRPLLVRSGILALALFCLGAVSFRTLRTVPLRAIRRSEDALRRERDSAQRYLDVAGVAFVILDDAARVTLVNRKGAEILERAGDEVLGKDWIATFVDPADRARVAAEMASPGRPGEVVGMEYAVLRPSGERRIISWYLTPLADEGQRTGLLASGVDITAQRELEADLRHAQKLEAIGRVAGGVAHDFNNILSTIKGYAGLLRRQLPPTDAARRPIDEILGAVDRAASLTGSLLTFGRRQVLQPEAIDLVEIVKRSEELLRRLVREDIELRTALPADPLPVVADPLQIERVLINLVTNARDATPAGGRIAIAASRVSLDAAEIGPAGVKTPGLYAQLSVADSGAGIDAETQAHIFEPFFTTKGVGKGTGLGLSIAHGIVKQHQGAIRVESEPGRGATFIFLLPLLGAPAGPAPGAQRLRHPSHTT